MKNNDWYEREGMKLMNRIAWEKHSIEEMEKKKQGHESVIINLIHPKMREAKKYIPETGEVLYDAETYHSCLRRIDVLDKDIKNLDVCIEDSNNTIRDLMVEQEQLNTDKLRSEVERQREEERKQQFLNTPFKKKEKSSDIPFQLDLFTE